MNKTSSVTGNSKVLHAIAQLKEGVRDFTIGELMKAVESAPDFPANKSERKALVEAYGKVLGFEPQDSGDSNYQKGAVIKLLGAALGASRATVDGFD